MANLDLLIKIGNEVIACKYDRVHRFNEGLASVKMNGKFGFIDKNGNEIIPFKYDDAFLFRKGLSKVEMKDKFGFINKSGENVIPCIYDDAGGFCRRLGQCIIQWQIWAYNSQLDFPHPLWTFTI